MLPSQLPDPWCWTEESTEECAPASSPGDARLEPKTVNNISKFGHKFDTSFTSDPVTSIFPLSIRINI